MASNILFVLIIIIQLFRAFILTQSRKNVKYLLVSFFMVSIPLEISKVVGPITEKISPGTLTPYYRITLTIVLCIILIPFSKITSIITPKLNHWVTGILLLILISLVNPLTASIDGTIVFAIFFISHILLFKLMGNLIDVNDIIKGIFDGFAILSIIQLTLAICFPVLNLIQVTTLFHAEGAIGATREGSRVGAIGLFSHPGRLALFSLYASSFFLSTFLYNYKKKSSLLMLVISLAIVFLTFSRTSYFTFIVVTVFLIYIKKNEKANIFSPFNLLRIFFPITLILAWIVFLSPFKSTFVESDAMTQVGNREIHYRMAYNIFKESPFVGVGLNSHVAYVNKHSDVLYNAAEQDLSAKNTEFFSSNPIHNIHLLFLAETGAIGFIMWVVFVVGNVLSSKNQISRGQNQILSLTFIGVLITTCLYGTTGWASLSSGIMPFLLMITYFSIRYKDSIMVKLIRLKPDNYTHNQ